MNVILTLLNLALAAALLAWAIELLRTARQKRKALVAIEEIRGMTLDVVALKVAHRLAELRVKDEAA